MLGGVEPWVTHHELSIEVPGERFLIRPCADSPGEYRYEWVSSPNPGYGFSGGFSGPVECTVADHVPNIETFLDKIAPDAGYVPNAGD